MYRSGSSTRVSDELFLLNQSLTPAATNNNTDSEDVQLLQLPTYNPDSHVGKKEKNRLRSSEFAIHLIPLLLVLCAAILWFFSSPVDMPHRGHHAANRTAT